jgi:hypothetical protein
MFGATGMVGAGVLIECLEVPRVRSVLVIGRHSVAISNPKLRELIRTDFFDYSDAGGDLSGYDACFFSIGVSAAGLSEPAYHRLTYELTIAAAEALVAFYNIFGRLYPVLRKLAPQHVTTTENVGRAMIQVAAAGYPRRVLENSDTNLLAAKAGDMSVVPGRE